MKTFSKIIFTVSFVLVANASFAPPPPPGGGSNPACWPICVPVDGGLVFLIMAISLFGIKKLYDHQKRVNAKV